MLSEEKAHRVRIKKWGKPGTRQCRSFYRTAFPKQDEQCVPRGKGETNFRFTSQPRRFIRIHRPIIIPRDTYLLHGVTAPGTSVSLAWSKRGLTNNRATVRTNEQKNRKSILYQCNSKDTSGVHDNGADDEQPERTARWIRGALTLRLLFSKDHRFDCTDTLERKISDRFYDRSRKQRRTWCLILRGRRALVRPANSSSLSYGFLLFLRDPLTISLGCYPATRQRRYPSDAYSMSFSCLIVDYGSLDRSERRCANGAVPRPSTSLDTRGCLSRSLSPVRILGTPIERSCVQSRP